MLEIFNIKIPYSFFESRIDFSWSDILWGYENRIIGWMDVVEFASKKVNENNANNEVETELFLIGKLDDYKINDLLKQLASSDIDSKDSKEKWLYIILLWLYENRFDRDDVLKDVDLMYADFDYPDEMDSFSISSSINFNSHNEKTKTECVQLLFDKWKDYLENSKYNKNKGLSR